MAQILLIEPDRMLAGTLIEALTARGHRVVAAASAQSGIMAADEVMPEVVILELQLIEHSGIEFLYEFRSYVDWRGVPVIIHSHVPPGEFSESWELLSRELGVQQYLYKPQTTLATLQKSITSLQPAAL